VTALDLPPGTLVANRYEIHRTLGRGGFSITYLADDERVERQVVLKELAPPGCSRGGDGELRLPDSPDASAHKIRDQFLGEARLLAKLRLDGVIQIFDAFEWGGTVFAVTEWIPEAVTLDRLLRAEGTLDEARTVTILRRLAETLAEVHRKGYLHRDIKPSNILLLGDDQPVLIDFGAAREWQADATVSHTALFTPGYAPIEQLGEKGRRGPATDIYALAATGFHMLSGAPPPSSADRIGGMPLPSLSGVTPRVAEAIRQGLALKAQDRPQAAEAFAQLLDDLTEPSESQGASRLDQMDRTLATLASLRVRRNKCPSCGELIEQPRSLRPGVCPVCRSGRIRKRVLDESRCPICRAGHLAKRRNYDPMSVCPLCKTGKLSRGSLAHRRQLTCGECNAQFSIPDRGALRLEKFGTVSNSLVQEGQSAEEAEFWLPLGGRGEFIATCESCSAEWDLTDGQMTLRSAPEDPFGVTAEHSSLSAAEWARVAMNLPPDAGNFGCDVCGADYFVEGDTVTLVDAETDAFGFLAAYQGKRLAAPELGFLAVGKSSGRDGLLCASCSTEFDFDGDYLRLRRATTASLAPHVGEARPADDWYRIAKGVPTLDQEAAYVEEFLGLLRQGLLTGDIEWAPSGLVWESEAERVTRAGEELELVAKGVLRIGAGLLEFSARARSVRIPHDAVQEASAEDDLLCLRITGEPEALLLVIPPEELTMEMHSGSYTVRLTASDCAEAIDLLRLSRSPIGAR
jgi:serine/threonine protein kinase